MQHEFRRVAIVDRGTAALRAIHAVREFNEEANLKLRAIALFTDSDRQALFVREADEAVYLGPDSLLDGRGGNPITAEDLAYLEKALQTAQADAVWIGWGWVSLKAEVAELCAKLGITFIGPSPTLIQQLSTPDFIRQLTKQADVEVHWAEDLTSYRYLVVPTLTDDDGQSWAFGVVDRTLTLEDAVSISETPSPVLSSQQESTLLQAAVRLVQAAGFKGAATVVFSWDASQSVFRHVWIAPGIQTDHALTEIATGYDLVKLQLKLALGGRLEGKPPQRTAVHAFGTELVAFPSRTADLEGASTVEFIRFPNGPGQRADTGTDEGDALSFVHYSSNRLAYLTSRGLTRAEALSRLKRLLTDSKIVIRSHNTNKSRLLAMLQRPDVAEGRLDSNLVETEPVNQNQFASLALIVAAVEAYKAEFAVEQAQFYSSVTRGRPDVRKEIGYPFELGYKGKTYRVSTYRLSPEQYRIDVDGKKLLVKIEDRSQFEKTLTVLSNSGTNHPYQILSVVEGNSYWIEINGVLCHITGDEGAVVRAPSPAVVVAITVNVGETVNAGDQIAILESMKMEMPVLASFAGTVRQVLVNNNVQVGTGAPLIRLDALTSLSDTKGDSQLDFAWLTTGTAKPVDTESEEKHRKYKQNYQQLRHLLLGFDVDQAETKRLIAEQVQTLHEVSPETPEIFKNHLELISTFVDIGALFRRPPVREEIEGEEEVLVSEEYFTAFLRTFDTKAAGIPASYEEKIRHVAQHYGVQATDRSPELSNSLLWAYKAQQRAELNATVIQNVLEHFLTHSQELIPKTSNQYRALLNRLIAVTENRLTVLNDFAKEVQFAFFEEPIFTATLEKAYQQVEKDLATLAAAPNAHDLFSKLQELVNFPHPLIGFFSQTFERVNQSTQQAMLEILTRRYYRIRPLEKVHTQVIENQGFALAEYSLDNQHFHVITTQCEYSNLAQTARLLAGVESEVPSEHEVVADFYTWRHGNLTDVEATAREVHDLLNQIQFPHRLRRITVAVACTECGRTIGSVQHFTFRPATAASEGDAPETTPVQKYEEEKLYRNLHPMIGKRLHLWRLSNFNIERLPSSQDVYLFHGVAQNNPKDARLFALAEVRDMTPVRDEQGRVVQLPHLERMLTEALAAIRLFQSQRAPHERLYWNRILLYVWPPFTVSREEFEEIVYRMGPATEGLGLEQVALTAKAPDPSTRELKEIMVRVSNPAGKGLLITYDNPPEHPLKPLEEYEQKVVRLRQRGLVYPYEIIRMLTPAPGSQSDFPPGQFIEYDLNAENQLVPVERPYGKNGANIVVGVLTNYTEKYPEGMSRVVLLGDPIKEMGSLSEPECRRINSAMELASERKIPLEWYALSAGAKISMESGTENMDWISLVLRRIIEHTQAGLEINVLVNGINVGAQPYWNAEATMLMHTRGILIMTPEGAMVLTGKQALDYSGSVSAEDNLGIGGYDRTMGPNGQAQYFARDLNEGIHLLLRHYDHSYVVPGERFPRRAKTTDPIDRNVCLYPHTPGGDGFATVGEIFSDETNPGRKKPFEIRRVMRAVSDQDQTPIERWQGMLDAETAVIWDAHIGGYPVCLLGFESHNQARAGFISTDGPYQWTSGTLFPQSSKKIARSINSASGNRPLVVLANLSGFDGSPESMRKVQLEYGAEIGRAVVNFKGPVVFVVVSRYHGGAFVVFSKQLNDTMEVVALEGTYASVIGGAPAAAVVFARDVDQRTRKDPRVQELEKEIAQATDADKRRLRGKLTELYKTVRSEKLGEVATEFDHIHSVHRALKVGSLDQIIPPVSLRPYIVEALERRIKEALEKA